MKMHHRKRWFLSGEGTRDFVIRGFIVSSHTKYFERGERKKRDLFMECLWGRR